MNIQEAIQHCEDVAKKCCGNECSIDHLQLQKWLVELVMYKKIYGDLPGKRIMVTKSNGHKELIRVDNIIRYRECIGVYNGTEYHTEIFCSDHTYYVRESVIEISKLLSK